MKTFIITAAFILCLSFAAFGQTVCISQEDADKSAKIALEYPLLKEAIEKFKAERLTGEAKDKANEILLAAKDAVIAIGEQKDLAQAKLLAVYQQIMDLQAKMIDQLEAKMLKPKSALDKFLSGIKEVLKAATYILAGAAIGRL
jgi:hypothetical protein